MKLSDFHIHPNYSIDGNGTIRQYCDRALEVGLQSICFTTHYDANPRRVEADGYWRYKGDRVRFNDDLLGRYFDEIDKARQFFAEFGLKVFRGLEIDYFPGVEDEAQRIRDKFDIQFIIGSVHCLDDIAISDKNEAPKYFLNRPISVMIKDYFGLLEKAAVVPAFDCLGHLDYYVRYGHPFYGNDIYNVGINHFDDVMNILKNHGKGIEINTSQYKFGKRSFHPDDRIIRRAVQMGVPIVSVGSDSHKPSTLGIGLKEAYDLMDELGTYPLFPIEK